MVVDDVRVKRRILASMIMHTMDVRMTEVLFTLRERFPFFRPKMSVFTPFYAAWFATAADYMLKLCLQLASDTLVRCIPRRILFLLFVFESVPTFFVRTDFFLFFVNTFDAHALHCGHPAMKPIFLLLSNHVQQTQKVSHQTALMDFTTARSMFLIEGTNDFRLP